VAVSRGVNVLAEHTDPQHRGNYETVTRQILRRIGEGGSRLAQLKYDDHTFHYSVVEGVTYVVMTAESAGSRLPVAFLEDVTRAFRGAYQAAWNLSRTGFLDARQGAARRFRLVQFRAESDTRVKEQPVASVLSNFEPNRIRASRSSPSLSARSGTATRRPWRPSLLR